MNIVRRDQFLGANNIAKPERLPEGAVADAVNFDFTVGGKAELRTGFTRIRDGEMRALFALGDSLVIADGDRLVHLKDGYEQVLATLGSGPVAGIEHAGRLYLNTLSESLVLDGSSVRDWGVQRPAFDVALGAGSLSAGLYKVAVTTLVDGVESGVVPMVISAPDGASIHVTLPAQGHNTVYCSAPNGLTLYRQAVALGSYRITSVDDDSERLETAGLDRFPFCESLESHKGYVVGSQGRLLFYTEPMRPHLHNPETGYLQFPAPITLIASVNEGLYVCADKTYFVAGLGTGEMFRRVAADYGAVAGTRVRLPDGSATWFSPYGQVLAGPDGQVQALNRPSYSPDIAGIGAAGLLEHNGNPMVVTTMRGEPAGSCMRSRDFWDLEVI